MREHGPSVLRLARSYLGDAHQAEDVFQDVFLRAYRSASSLRDRGAVKTWLLSVTANRCRDLLRSWGRRNVVPTAELPELPHHDGVDDTDVELVEAVLSLPLPLREVVFLHYYEGLSPAEIGKLLGVPMVTVRTRLHRARHALRSRLAEGVLADA